jgi:hypothetical protein
MTNFTASLLAVFASAVFGYAGRVECYNYQEKAGRVVSIHTQLAAKWIDY